MGLVVSLQLLDGAASREAAVAGQFPPIIEHKRLRRDFRISYDAFCDAGLKFLYRNIVMQTAPLASPGDQGQLFPEGEPLDLEFPAGGRRSDHRLAPGTPDEEGAGSVCIEPLPNRWAARRAFTSIAMPV